MENASRAMIIAGAVLLAIMIISLGVVVYRNFSSSVEDAGDMSEEEISSYNSKILPYVGNNISGSQVNALIQLIYSMDRNLHDNKITMNWYDNTGDGSINDQGAYAGTTRKVETGTYYTVEIEYSNMGLISHIDINVN